ncbi:Crp/Fnr family transcriptional regulator [Spirosoma areae]
MKAISTEELEAGYLRLKTLVDVTSPISDVTWQYFRTHSQPCFYEKKTKLVHEGERPQMLGFIIQGAAKSYYSSPIDGRQVVTRLHVPNDFCVSANFHLGEVAVDNIEFVADSWLICISHADVVRMYATFPDYTRLYATLLGHRSRMHEEKVRDLQMLTVGQRLEKLIATNPHYFNYFPVADIASYLGTERETLTRLRSKLYKQ